MALARPCFSTNERFTFLAGPQQGNKRWCGIYKAQRSHLRLFVVINISFLWVKCQPSIRNRTLLSTEHPSPSWEPLEEIAPEREVSSQTSRRVELSSVNRGHVHSCVLQAAPARHLTTWQEWPQERRDLRKENTVNFFFYNYFYI